MLQPHALERGVSAEKGEIHETADGADHHYWSGKHAEANERSLAEITTMIDHIMPLLGSSESECFLCDAANAVLLPCAKLGCQNATYCQECLLKCPSWATAGEPRCPTCQRSVQGVLAHQQGAVAANGGGKLWGTRRAVGQEESPVLDVVNAGAANFQSPRDGQTSLAEKEEPVLGSHAAEGDNHLFVEGAVGQEESPVLDVVNAGPANIQSPRDGQASPAEKEEPVRSSHAAEGNNHLFVEGAGGRRRVQCLMFSLVRRPQTC